MNCSGGHRHTTYISLYFGVGSGLKRVRVAVLLKRFEISLYFGVGSGLKLKC